MFKRFASKPKPAPVGSRTNIAKFQELETVLRISIVKLKCNHMKDKPITLSRQLLIQSVISVVYMKVDDVSRNKNRRPVKVLKEPYRNLKMHKYATNKNLPLNAEFRLSNISSTSTTKPKPFNNTTSYKNNYLLEKSVGTIPYPGFSPNLKLQSARIPIPFTPILIV
ncbi:hypothetical protein HDV02_000428 [Globomyces sp. JEL0801]|nr:hypothetical protein HDV02_000428 [Globomyces sp. JEL0801]